MTETAYGYFCDLLTQWGQTLASTHYGETMFTESGRRQSLTFGPQKLRTFTAKFIDEPPIGVVALTAREVRAMIDDFNDARGGAHGQSFNFWNPFPGPLKRYPGVPAGVAGATLTITAAPTVILPWRITNPSGGVIGQIYDVRVGGVSQVFTIRHLLPSPRSFASLRFSTTMALSCGSQSSLRATGDQAIGAWVWLASATDFVIAGNATFNASGVQLEITSAGVIRFVTEQAGGQVIAACSGTTVPLQTWTHVMAVKSGTTVTFYKNGVVNGAAVTGVTNPVVATIPFVIGAGTVDAMIGDVRYYNSAPSAAEILNIYKGNHTPTANLKGWWRLDEGWGTAVADISGSAGNGGTVTGTAPWVAGHEEIVFSGGAQTGAVTVVIYGRELMICGFGAEPMPQTFIPTGGEVRAAFQLVIQERY